MGGLCDGEGYPTADRDDIVEIQHGVPVADPYRWLEDPQHQRTRHWIAAQNARTGKYLATLPARAQFATRLETILGTPRAGTPRNRGGRYLRTYNDGSAPLDVVQVADDLPTLLSSGRLLLDPTEFDQTGGIALSGLSVSPDGRWAAYGLSSAGSDWVEWRVRDIDTGQDTADRVTHSKFSTATWLPDSTSFLYWGYPEHPSVDGANAAALGAGQLRRHRLSTAQAYDEVIYHNPQATRELVSHRVTEDGRWLVLTASEGTAQRNTVAVRRIGAAGELGPRLDVVAQPDAQYGFAGSDGDILYLRTDLDAPRSRLVAVDLAAVAAGQPIDLQQLVPEQEDVLAMVTRAGDGFLATYLQDAQHRVYRLARDGVRRSEVALPAPISVLNWSAWADDDEAFVGVTSFLEPSRSYRVDLATGSVTVLPVKPGDDAGAVSTIPTTFERRYATSRDGTQAPYTLVRRADTPPDTALPTLLYGYGGFNIAVTPDFKPIWPAWVEAGGALAVANLRGGGEFGRHWYEAGTRERKQNVFDDFIAVAQHLVATGVTSHEKLALHGRSNGGLLVAAVMTQRPALAAVALPSVAVMDMLRFHRFTIGWAWTADLGDPDEPDDFAVLQAYSPLHNLRVGEHYPATLVVTADHDDRAVPAHSLKFAATLQHAQGGAAPVLARIEQASGHGVGKTRQAQVAEASDLLAFAAEHTGLSIK